MPGRNRDPDLTFESGEIACSGSIRLSLVDS